MSAFVAELLRGDGPVRATGIAMPRAGSWVVGDVRLDGRDELRDALGGAGVATAKNASDSALVLAAWTAWRETATERLIGDYTFALWDHREHTLFCARDPLGVRPLYWAEMGRTFLCGNVLDDLRADPRVSSRLHEPAIVSFLVHGFNADTATTTFAAVRRLPPGHQLVVREATGAPATRRYWSFPTPPLLHLRRDEEYVERFRDVLGAAVRDRVRTDSAAIMLSGGLDSTALAATVHRVAPATRLTAWTNDVGPLQPADELRLAAEVALRIGAEHRVVYGVQVPLAHLDTPGFHSPEPLDEPEWGSWIAQLAAMSSGASVLIDGEDGDALFRAPGLLTMLRSWPAHDVLARIARYTIAHRRYPHLGIWLRRGLRSPFAVRPVRAPGWIHSALLARTGTHDPIGPPVHPTRPDAVRYLGDPVWQIVFETAQEAYTGVPLGVVWPLLDTRVIEFVFSIPPVPWCQRKELLRCAFRGELPDEVLRRRKSPLSGYYEAQVARWRTARGGVAPALNEAIREFVDTRRVVDTLQRGSVAEVLVAWRAVILDRWLRGAGCGRA